MRLREAWERPEGIASGASSSSMLSSRPKGGGRWRGETTAKNGGGIVACRDPPAAKDEDATGWTSSAPRSSSRCSIRSRTCSPTPSKRPNMSSLAHTTSRSSHHRSNASPRASWPSLSRATPRAAHSSRRTCKPFLNSRAASARASRSASCARGWVQVTRDRRRVAAAVSVAEEGEVDGDVGGGHRCDAGGDEVRAEAGVCAQRAEEEGFSVAVQ
jgi:hypothetical protein